MMYIKTYSKAEAVNKFCEKIVKENIEEFTRQLVTIEVLDGDHNYSVKIGIAPNMVKEYKLHVSDFSSLRYALVDLETHDSLFCFNKNLPIYDTPKLSAVTTADDVCNMCATDDENSLK